MSSPPFQGHQPLQPKAMMSSPSAAQETLFSQAEQDASHNQKLMAAQEAANNQGLTNGGKRSLSQLDRPVKFGRVIAETDDPGSSKMRFSD